VPLIGPDRHGRIQACLWALQVPEIHLSLSKENAQLDFGQGGSLIKAAVIHSNAA
jgi:hypothetical protein